MSSDNTILKDGLQNEFTSRAKDISAAGDGSLRKTMVLSTAHPAEASGSFQKVSKSGVMAAGLAASSPIYSFRWSNGSSMAVLRRLRLAAWSLATGFTPGIATFDLRVARNFIAADSGQMTDTLTGNNGKMRTSLATSLASIMHATTAGLTVGTRTLDASPADTLNFGVGSAANTPFAPGPINLFERLQGEQPLVMAAQEGFVIEATVPATGTWAFAVTAEWDEIANNFM